MDWQEKYDELDNIISSINILVDEIKDTDYIYMLNEIKYQAQNEMEEVEEKLQAEQDREYAEREKEYWNSQF